MPSEVEVFDPMIIFAAMMGVDPAIMESAMTIDAAKVPEDAMMMDPSEFGGFEMSPEEVEEFTKEMEKALEGLESINGGFPGPIAPEDQPDLTP